MYVMRGMCPVVVAAVLAGAAACDSPTGSSSPGQPLAFTRLRSEPFSLSYASGLKETQRIVVTDANTWQQVWSSIWRGSSPELPMPQVDFESQIVVVAAMGERLTGGFTILIDSASETAAGMSIRIRSISPGAGCGTTQALTQPVDVARVSRHGGAVTFDERTETRQCR
jgi:hypothetical protein